jgi:hypothetical protein
MSPRTVAVLVAALIGIAVGVYAVSRDIATTSRETTESLTRRLAMQSVAGCARAVADRVGLQTLNDDLAVFAAGAAVRRRAEGNVGTARTYEAVVRRSRARSRELAQRLPPSLSCTDAFRTP